MSNLEEKQVELTLGGETRTVTISRFSEKHCWHCCALCVGRFPTGEKLHTIFPQVVEQGGKWCVASGHRMSSRTGRITPTAFYDEAKHKALLANKAC